MRPVRRIAAFCATCLDLVPHTLVDAVPKTAFCDGCGNGQEVLVAPA